MTNYGAAIGSAVGAGLVFKATSKLVRKTRKKKKRKKRKGGRK